VQNSFDGVDNAQSTVAAVEMYEWLGQCLKTDLRAYVLTSLGQTTHQHRCTDAATVVNTFLRAMPTTRRGASTPAIGLKLHFHSKDK